MLPTPKRMLIIILFDFVMFTLLLFAFSHKHFSLKEVPTPVTWAETIQPETARTETEQTVHSQSASSPAGHTGTHYEPLQSDRPENKKIALTFDDGPHPYYTEQLLDGLKNRGIIVTFFVLDHSQSI